MLSKKDPDPLKPEYSSLVPAVEQASRILLALAQAEGGKMTLTEVCSAVGIHKSKGYSILNTLQHFSFVQRAEYGKTYSLGPGLLFLSSKVLNNMDLRETAAPFLHKLSRDTNSTAFLGLVSDDHVFVIAKDEGMQDIGIMIRLGHRFPLAWGAHGKAIVAFLPEVERKKVLDSSTLYFHGSTSKLDLDRLGEEFNLCRKAGFAMDLGDMKSGIHAVASPVFGPGEKLIGALAVVGTFARECAEGFGSEVAEAARKFSELVGGAPQLSVQQFIGAKVLAMDELRPKQED
ncbi:MAG: IclR family transcriptional regulator [Desulfomonile tiedjei]|uniref:IclR family transcriptional regulator n=1 Tax=Desulfomonile tiedjei TaxID=2358 RepID=A0A9D6V1Y7_9BACT|nr:IclR family transcriptional regulator [Desulfomonile tiedjei]